MLSIPDRPIRAEVRAEILRPRHGGSFASDSAGPLPYVLPGEIVEVASAAGSPRPPDSLHILAPASGRVAPACVHFGACGGCHYQHASYATQLEFKREILGDLLDEALPGPLPPIRLHHAEPWGYRNRIRVRIERQPGAPATPLVAGYSRSGSNDFLPIRMCPIAAPLLWRAVETLLSLAARDSLCRRWLDATSEVELFCLPDQARLQLSFFLRDLDPGQRDPSSFAAFCEQVRGELPELAGAAAEPDPDLNRRTRRRWVGATWGVAGLAYPAAGRAYWVGRGAFFQVNRFLVDQLVALVTDGERGELAWDLFAGVGLFTRASAEGFRQVVAVEGGEAASADLRRASLGGKGQPAFGAVRSSTLDFLRAQELQRERPELIVLDPPRAGIGAEAAGILARLAAPRVVYVSCDPVTLAQDLAILTRDAYRIDTLDMIDLFPQTYHIETVVHLSR